MRRWLLAGMIAATLLASSAGARAGQDDPRLDGLFAALRAAGSPVEARRIEIAIWQIWTESPDRDTRRLMRQGIAALASDDDQTALAQFNQVVARSARFAEGWNKRATVEYMMGDFAASVADIERTLALEPRHFGALSGLGEIYLSLGRKAAALKAFEAALAIDPFLAGVKETVAKLQRELAGAPI